MGHASTLLHGLQHELSISVGHAWDYGNNGRVSDLHEEGRCAILLHGLQHKWLPKALLQAKGDRVTVAGGTHPSHEVVITCMGLRKRRARGRSCEHVLEPLLRRRGVPPR